MAQAVNMPKLGFDMAEGTLLNWVKQIGDKINGGDVLAEIETDKATIEIEVPGDVSGTLLQLLAEPGDVLAVGSPIAYVGAEGEAVSSGSAAPKASAAAAEAAPESQAAPPAPAPASNGQSAKATAPSQGTEFPGGVKASPLARRIANEKGVDLQMITGSGPAGRIVRRDVETFEAPREAPAPQAAAPAAGIAAPSFGPLPSGPDVEVIDISRLRDRIAKRMVEAKQQVPHFYVTTEVDVDAMLALRAQLNDGIEPERKISVNDMVVKAAALALRKFPNLNTHYYGDKLVRYKRIHIGIAVSLPDGGLMNVVAKDADRTALGTMAQRNREMAGRARDGKVKPEDIEGSTFSLSNLGPWDVDFFSAIINPPEAAILAVSSAHKVPVVKEDGTLGVGTRMKITLSVDHRVSDGAEGADYLKELKGLIENPMRLVI